MSAFIGDVELCGAYGQCQHIVSGRPLEPVFGARCGVCGDALKDNWPSLNPGDHFYTCENNGCACWRYGMLYRIDWRVSYRPTAGPEIDTYHYDADHRVPLQPGAHGGYFITHGGWVSEVFYGEPPCQ